MLRCAAGIYIRIFLTSASLIIPFLLSILVSFLALINFSFAQIFNNRIIRFLEESANTLSLIRDEDRLVAYRVPKDIPEAPQVVFTHQQKEE